MTEAQQEVVLDLDAIEARFTAEEVPDCRVCGAKLSIRAFGGGKPTVWACSTVNVGDPDWYTHYVGSKFEQRKHGDSEVLALVREARIRQLVIDEGQEVLADVIAQRRQARDIVDRVVALLEQWRKTGNGAGLHGEQLEEAILGMTGSVCPECRAGKCRNCDGTSWDEQADKQVTCPCDHGILLGVVHPEGD